MSESEEQAYNDGIRQAAVMMMGEILSMIGRQPATEALILERERAQVVNILRQVCEEHGDNDWPDNLNLSDVIEKHLWRHLEECRCRIHKMVCDELETCQRCPTCRCCDYCGIDQGSVPENHEEQQTVCSVCKLQSIRKNLAICHCGRYAHCRCIDQCRHIDQ
jgi:hypothetical protein